MIVHPLAEAMRRALGLDTTTEENRHHNTITGWTYADAFGSSTVSVESRLPCRLDIPGNDGACYWCGDPVPHPPTKEP